MIRLAIATIVFCVASLTPASGQQREPVGRLFPPEALATLEGPDRDEWQQPDRIMDVLGVADGGKVADIGAGGGWFTIRLAHRVGPNGTVYAVDIQPKMIEAIKRRVQREGLPNVRPILATPDDPMLPPGIQAALIVDTYPQVSGPVALLQRITKLLAPHGRIGVVDFKKDGSGGPGPPINERLDPDSIIRDAQSVGLKLRSMETFLRYQYFLVFVK